MAAFPCVRASATHHGEGKPALEGVVDAQHEAHLLPPQRARRQRSWRGREAGGAAHHGRRLTAALVGALAPFPVLLLRDVRINVMT